MNYNNDVNNHEQFVTLQKARHDLIGEIQAIMEYDDHIHSATNEMAQKTWQNIRDEELVHVGELLALLHYLAPYQKTFVEEGVKEFRERLNKN